MINTVDKKDYNLNINYDQLLSKSWAGVLQPLLKTEYMANLMSFLHESYKVQNVRPNKKDVFRPFKMLPFGDLKVVIIGDEPYPNYESTGLAFANKEGFGKTFSPQLTKIMKTVERTMYDGINLYMDPTLEYWAHQDILLLNSALTTQVGYPGSHLKYWRNFTRELVKTIDEWKSGIIFCLWGEEAQYFKQYINPKRHFILEAENPFQAVLDRRDWDCNHFEEINNILNRINGQEAEIDW